MLPILTPPLSLMIAAPASMERWLEMPHDAAGPLVTPTKPILSTVLAAKVVGELTPVKAKAAVISEAFKNVILFIICS